MQPNVFVAADYADALLTAKRAKNLVFFAILMILLGELSLFFVARYTHVLSPFPENTAASIKRQLLQYGIGMVGFGGIIFPTLLAIILALILHILLRGRLLGTAAFTTAFLWCVVLVLLLFPWQAFLNNPAINSDTTANALGLKIPGALYTWAEITSSQNGGKISQSGLGSLLRPALVALRRISNVNPWDSQLRVQVQEQQVDFARLIDAQAAGKHTGRRKTSNADQL